MKLSDKAELAACNKLLCSCALLSLSGWRWPHQLGGATQLHGSPERASVLQRLPLCCYAAMHCMPCYACCFGTGIPDLSVKNAYIISSLSCCQRLHYALRAWHSYRHMDARGSHGSCSEALGPSTLGMSSAHFVPAPVCSVYWLCKERLWLGR